MTEQTASKVPQIRFKGFEGEWECKNLRDLTETGFTNGVFNDPNKVGRGYRLINVKDMFSGSSIDVDNLSLIDIDENEFKKNRVRYGDIFFTRSSLVKEGIACSNVNLSAYQNMTFDGHLIRMQPCRKIADPIFLSYAFKTDSSRRQFILGGKTTTMTTIGQSDIAVVEVALPTPTEQNQIGEYFRELDRLIGLHQHKHDKLVTLKKAMLQKMFPQAGATIPEIRFKGFSGDWKPYELGEITTKIGSGKTPRGGKTGYLSSGIPLIRSQNIFSDSVNFEGIAFISDETDEEMSNSRVLQNDVLLNITGASIGRSAVYRSGERANVNQHVCIIRASGNHHSDFIQLNLASTRGQAAIDNSQAGGAREGLNFQQIGKFCFQFPSHTEQTQIGTYFRQLDALISKHATQLQKLQQLKSACLERMFV